MVFALKPTPGMNGSGRGVPAHQQQLVLDGEVVGGFRTITSGAIAMARALQPGAGSSGGGGGGSGNSSGSGAAASASAAEPGLHARQLSIASSLSGTSTPLSQLSPLPSPKKEAAAQHALGPLAADPQWSDRLVAAAVKQVVNRLVNDVIMMTST